MKEMNARKRKSRALTLICVRQRKEVRYMTTGFAIELAGSLRHMMSQPNLWRRLPASSMADRPVLDTTTQQCICPSQQPTHANSTHTSSRPTSSGPDVAMAVDPLSPIAVARIRALLLPVGRIKRSRFLAFVDLLQQQSLVRLGDISPDPRPDRSTSPQSLIAGPHLLILARHRHVLSAGISRRHPSV